jgi:DNA-binding PadR family transcriptional regulator
MSTSPEEKKGGTKKPSEKQSADREPVEAGTFRRRSGPDSIETDLRGGSPDSGRGRGRRGPRGRHGDHGDHGHGEGRGRGGPRARRGEVRNAVIALLAEGPKHGYQLIQEMGERSGGVWSPSPGSIYPILHRLAAAGVVEAEEVEDGRRIFRLTAKGQQAAERLTLLGDAPWTTIGDTESDEARQLRQAALQFDGAITQVAQVATTDQLIRATAIVADSRRRLYALLAEEPAPERAASPDDAPAS